MSTAAPLVEIRPRAAGDRRPSSDPRCAGCALMGALRALRRAGLELRGGPGCDPSSPRTFAATPGRWAAIGGVAAIAADDGAGVERVRRAGARVIVVADRRSPGADERIAAALDRAGVRAFQLDGADPAAAERVAVAAREAELAVALVALVPCVRGAPRGAPLAIAPARCNRCGACLGLGCPAISDRGGEAMAIDAATCTGCGACAGLCRSGAIR